MAPTIRAAWPNPEQPESDMRDDTRPPRDGKDPSPVRALRLVHPSPPKPPKRRYRRGGPPLWAPEEAARLRAALRTARTMFGTWACAADALYVVETTLIAAANGRAPVSGNIAVRLARALGKPLDALLRPPSDASRCPSCGRGAP